MSSRRTARRWRLRSLSTTRSPFLTQFRWTRRSSRPAAIAGYRSGLTSFSTRPRRRTNVRLFLLAAPPLAFLLLFFVYPGVNIMVRGLAPNGEFDLAGFVE